MSRARTAVVAALVATVAAWRSALAEAPQAYFALRDHPEKCNTLVFKW
jgi:hypothetical protein